MKILPLMNLWTKKFLLNVESYSDSGSGFRLDLPCGGLVLNYAKDRNKFNVLK